MILPRNRFDPRGETGKGELAPEPLAPTTVSRVPMLWSWSQRQAERGAQGMGSIALTLLVISLPFSDLYHVLITLQAHSKTKETLRSICGLLPPVPSSFLPECLEL